MTNRSLSNEPDLNKDGDDADLGTLYNAIQSGDSEELGRLMTADVEEDPDKKADKVVEGDPPNDPSKEAGNESNPEDNVEDEDKKDQESDESDDSGKQKEAAPAASNPNAADEVSTLKAQIEELRSQNHKYMSDAGRVPYLQRRLAELERQARAAPARQSPATTGGNASISDEDLKNVELDPVTQKEIDDLKEVDPVVARTMERTAKAAALIAQRRFEAALNERDNSSREIEDSRFFEEQMSELTSQIPQAPQIFQTREWSEWKAGLTPGQRAMAESPYAVDVVRAIHAFAADMQARMGTQQQAPSGQSNTATPPEAQNQVAEARARKADSSPEVRNPSAKNTSDIDEDKLFSQMYTQEGKKSHIL